MKSPRFPRRVASRRLNMAIVESLEVRQLLSGSLAFAPARVLPVGGGPDALIVADVNGDGFPDIVTANYNGTVSFLFGQAAGQFAAAKTFSDGLSTGVAVETFTTTGDDLIVGTGNQAAVFAAADIGGPQLVQTLTFTNDVSALATISITGDGKPDLVVGYQNGTIGLFSPGTSTVFSNTPYSAPTVGLGTGAIDSLAVADFTANQPGLVIGDGNGSVYVVSGFGSSSGSNGSGGLGFGTVTFTTVLNGNGVASPFVNVITGNFNGDTAPDIIATTYGGDVTFIPGNTDGTFGAPQVQTSLPSGVVAGVAAAFSGNGVPEPLLVNSTTDQFSVLGGNNTGTFATPVSFSAGTIPDAVQTASINGDGRSDVIVADYYTHSVSVLLNVSTIAPQITSANSTKFVTGVDGSFAIISSGFPTSSYVTESGKLPPGVAIINHANGPAILTGAPAAGTGGTYNLTLTSNNSVGAGPPQFFTLTVDQPVTFTSAKTAQFGATFGNTFTVTTAGFPVPTVSERGLPTGTGLTFTDGLNGTATITGTPTAAAGTSYSILLTSGTGVGGAPSQAFTLTVVPGGITSANNFTFTAGMLQTFFIMTTGFPASTATVTETGVLPAGITLKSLTNNTAALGGTPGATTGKTYPITLTARSGSLPPYTQVFTLTVEQVPAFTSANHFTFTTGAAGTFQVAASGFPAPTLSVNGNLPTGVMFNTSTGQLAGTPAAGQGGTYALTLTAENAANTLGVLQTFTATVNQSPAITSTNSFTFTAGTPATMTITTTGFPLATVTESGALPAGVTFKNLGNGTATISGTPGATTGKAYAIVLGASNGVLPAATQAFTLTVDQAPAITSANHATFKATGGTFAITTTGFPLPSVTETDSDLPTGINLTLEANGTFDLTAGAGVTSGTYTVTLNAQNAAGSATPQAFTLIVT
jgi:large repetitive protein